MAQQYTNQDILYPYPMIGVALEDIFRPNPGIIHFNIRDLTQDFTKTSMGKPTSSPVSKSNIMNDNKELGISKRTVLDNIPIKVPRELTGYLNGHFKVNEFSYYDNTHQWATEVGGSSHPAGPHTHDHWVGGHGFKEERHGESYHRAIDNTIKKGSLWVIVFIGGSPQNPVVIARYYSSDDRGLPAESSLIVQ